MGNLKANAIYNPDERRNRPPTDFDESDRDSEMEKYIRNKYQYKRFLAPTTNGEPAPSSGNTAPQFAPVRSPSPPTYVPRPPAKDPVPGRVGGASLGEASEFDKVIRAPSRAKSTPIVSPSASGFGGRTNVLSPSSPAIPSVPSSSRAPVFEPTLPYRPSTAAALEAPYASASSSASGSTWPSSSSYRTSNTASAPPIPPITYPMRPYSAASTSTTPANNFQQPPLQYLSPSSATPSSDGLWGDLSILSGTGASGSGLGATAAASHLGSTAFTSGMTNGTVPGLGRPNMPSPSGTLPLSSAFNAQSLGGSEWG